MDYLIMLTAMALDTLPEAGRALLLAVLLASALCGFARLKLVQRDIKTGILMRKGALGTVLLVPALVYLTSLRMPVYVDQMVAFPNSWSAVVTYSVLVLWVGGVLFLAAGLTRQLARMSARIPPDAAPEKMTKRAAHWAKRLGLSGEIRVVSAAASLPWHSRARTMQPAYVVVLPAAARNWPTGVVDVCLLTQLAQIKNRDWLWMVFSRVVAIVFWPLPWVRGLVEDFCASLVAPSQDLAAAAYRDPVGWQRDLRQTLQRLDTLDVHHKQGLQLSSFIQPQQNTDVAQEAAPEGPLTYAERRRISKARVRAKHHDPHEKAYWLIASACLVVGVASTLTIVQAPPEFEPRFLHIKWQDQVARRYSEESEVAPRPGPRQSVQDDAD